MDDVYDLSKFQVQKDVFIYGILMDTIYIKICDKNFWSKLWNNGIYKVEIIDQR